MLRVFGASDDLVEFEGDVRGEVDCYDRDVLVACSDGTVLRVHYGKPNLGVWAITVLNKGTCFDRIEVCTDEDGSPYSDQVFLRDGVSAAWAATLKSDESAIVS